MPSAQHEAVIAKLAPHVHAPHLSFEERQAGFAGAAAALFPTVAVDVKTRDVDAGGIPAEWVSVPESREDRVVFYLHGGGYTQGSPLTHRELASRVARRSQARALSVDYRLAPGAVFPAAVEDSLKAYRWLAKSFDPKRIAFVGDSAGGGLAMATLFSLRDAGEKLPACAALMSPWLDLAGSSEAVRTTDDPIIEVQHMLDVGRLYLGKADARHPLASPLYGDFRGLPPLLIQAGTREIFIGEARRAAEIARQAGVEVTLDAWDGLIHVWQIWGDTLPEAREAVVTLGEFVRKHVPDRA